MKYVGVDLHKKSISICVMTKVEDQRKVVQRQRFACRDTEGIRQFFEQLGAPFQVVVEATASYEWFFLLIEDLAERLVLAHPKKLRVIAESKHKSDKIDAQVLAEFLAVDMIVRVIPSEPQDSAVPGAGAAPAVCAGTDQLGEMQVAKQIGPLQCGYRSLV